MNKAELVEKTAKAPGPAKGIDANQAIVTANLERPTSGAPVKDAHLPPFGLFPENTSPIQ